MAYNLTSYFKYIRNTYMVTSVEAKSTHHPPHMRRHIEIPRKPPTVVGYAAPIMALDLFTANGFKPDGLTQTPPIRWQLFDRPDHLIPKFHADAEVCNARLAFTQTPIDSDQGYFIMRLSETKEHIDRREFMSDIAMITNRQLKYPHFLGRPNRIINHQAFEATTTLTSTAIGLGAAYLIKSDLSHDAILSTTIVSAMTGYFTSRGISEVNDQGAKSPIRYPAEILVGMDAVDVINIEQLGAAEVTFQEQLFAELSRDRILTDAQFLRAYSHLPSGIKNSKDFDYLTEVAKDELSKLPDHKKPLEHRKFLGVRLP